MGIDNLSLVSGDQNSKLRTETGAGPAAAFHIHVATLHDEGGVVVLQTLGRVAFLGYAIHQPGVEARDQISDLSIAIACKVMRSLCGESWKPTEVLLSRDMPKDLPPSVGFIVRLCASLPTRRHWFFRLPG